MSVSFHLIVAHDTHLGIGINNTIPWRLSEDMAFFKHTTVSTKDSAKQNSVIMGRKTWESLPASFRPLPDRHNIIVTSQQTYQADHAQVVHSIPQALSVAADLQQTGTCESTFCIGGGQLYTHMLTLPECEGVYATVVESQFECDAFFPEYRHTFQCISTSEPKTSKNGITFGFQYWKKA